MKTLLRKTRIQTIICLGTILSLALWWGCNEAPSDPGPVQKPTTGLTFVDLYDQSPSINTCEAGILKPAERTKVLNYVNSIRALHSLGPVNYASADDPAVTEASVIMLSNNILDHNPPSSYTCWTQNGATAASKSNLAMVSAFDSGVHLPSSEALIDQWLKDSTVTELGHRRWLLDPFLKKISFGRADRSFPNGSFIQSTTAATIQVIYDEHQAPSDALIYVAYPVGDYPKSLYNKNLDMSFSVVVDPLDFWKNSAVNYSASSVKIVSASGTQVPVTQLRGNNDVFGLGNALFWRADILPNTTYTITIKDVTYNGTTKSFSYDVRLQ